MITSYGYISENLDNLTIEDLECSLRDMAKESFGQSSGIPLRIRKQYMEELAWRYNRQTIFSLGFEQRLQRANEILVRDSERIIRKAYGVYNKCMEAISDQQLLNSLIVTAWLKIPAIKYVTSKIECNSPELVDKDLWNAYAETINANDCFEIRLCSKFNQFGGLNDLIRYKIWGAKLNEEIHSWAHSCGLPEHIAKSDYIYCWPFHNMLDECSFPMKWLLMVTEYDYEIKLEYTDKC